MSLEDCLLGRKIVACRSTGYGRLACLSVHVFRLQYRVGGGNLRQVGWGHAGSFARYRCRPCPKMPMCSRLAIDHAVTPLFILITLLHILRPVTPRGTCRAWTAQSCSLIRALCLPCLPTRAVPISVIHLAPNLSIQRATQADALLQPPPAAWEHPQGKADRGKAARCFACLRLPECITAVLCLHEVGGWVDEAFGAGFPDHFGDNGVFV